MKVHNLKMVVVGDVGVGKTSLLKRYVRKTFDPEWIASVFEGYGEQIKVPGTRQVCTNPFNPFTTGYTRLRYDFVTNETRHIFEILHAEETRLHVCVAWLHVCVAQLHVSTW